MMFTLAELESALKVVRAAIPPTPQYLWPVLKGRVGLDVILKHENHTPTGAFKVRGGLYFFERLVRERQDVKGVATATRGNHGQSLAFAGTRAGLPVVVVVPKGNSATKNAAMRAFGAELIEYGSDFDEAKVHAQAIAAERGYEFVSPFHPDLVLGVATYAYELFTEFSNLDVVYVPIGLGSGICGLIGTRNVLGLKTRIVGVVAERANAYRLSFEQGTVVETNSALTFADGVAVRVPDSSALEFIRRGAERVIEVTEDEIAEAVRILFSDTHTLVEGASAAALAGLFKEREHLQGGRAAVIMTGQNIERTDAQIILAGGTPQVGQASESR